MGVNDGRAKRTIFPYHRALLFALLLFSMPIVDAQIVNTTKGILSYWNMDTAYISSGQILDLISSPNSQNLVLHGPTTGASGEINQSFTYSPTQYINSSNSMDVQKNFTIIMWLLTNSYGADEVFIDLRSVNLHSLVFFVQQTTGKVGVFGTDINTVFLTSSDALGTGAWRMVTIRKTDTNLTFVFDNNIQEGVYTASIGSIQNESGAFTIGSRYDHLVGWNGGIDESCLWGRALNDSEVVAIFGNKSCIVSLITYSVPVISVFTASGISNTSILLHWEINGGLSNLSLTRNGVVVYVGNSSLVNASALDLSLTPNTSYNYTLFITGPGGISNSSVTASTLANTPSPESLTEERLLQVIGQLSNLNEAISMLWIIFLAIGIAVLGVIYKHPVIWALEFIPILLFVIGLSSLSISTGNNMYLNFSVVVMILGGVYAVFLGYAALILPGKKSRDAEADKRNSFYGRKIL